MRIGLVYLKPQQVACVRAAGPYPTSSKKAWDDMFAWMARNELQNVGEVGYGLAYDHADPVTAEHRRYDACIKLPPELAFSKTDALPLRTLPGGAFFRYRHVGLHETLGPVISRVRQEWLAAQSALVVDRRRPLLVIYLDPRQLQSSDDHRCDICIPVRTIHDEIYSRSIFSESPTA